MKNIEKILKAIRKINVNAEMYIEGEDIDTCSITWLEDTTPISKEDIKAKMDEIDNEPEQSNYAEQRRNAYPEIGDQLDMLWHSIDQNAELKQNILTFIRLSNRLK